ncbi:hypothetical protein [Bradyrhizobium canariense]|uniref:hypothetical protein n=1 Tax=Bradyrhizobium canariense TaxID=255045 RepID=UPI001177E4BE|nr:hypothetical protein [Bradyrhizobium canariense]
MSKTEPPAKLPAPLVPAFSDRTNSSKQTWSEWRAMGARECVFTTVRFDLKSRASAYDTLKIEIDGHNGAPPSRLEIRGQIEAAEIPSQLRWLADAIAQHGESKSSAIRESVTYKKSCGGAA